MSSRSLVRALPASLLAASALLLAVGAGAQNVPVAEAGDAQLIPCAPPAGAEVTLDGTGSTDPDPGAVLTYTWTGDALGVGTSVDGATPTVVLPPGVHVLTLTVDDGIDGSSTDDVEITVVADTELPQLVLAADAAELWPPNHKPHLIDAADLVASVSDACDTEMSAADVVFARGTSDEEDNGIGDGNTTGDLAFDVGCMTALVRAERAGPGDGRVYELFLEARDAAGNAAEAVFTVSVPHDRAHSAVDSGDVFEVAGECAPLELCPPEPSETCEDAPRADVQIKDRGKRGPNLRWRARGFAAAEGEFGDESADYQLCVYTEDAEGAILEDDPAAPHGRGWKHGKKGASFKGRKAGHAARLAGLKLGEKKGAGVLSASAGGDDVNLPELPLADGTSLVLQLRDSEGECVESEFDDPEVNDEDAFEDEVETE